MIKKGLCETIKEMYERGELKVTNENKHILIKIGLKGE